MEKKRATSLRRGALLRFFLSIAVIITVFLGTVGWLAGNIRPVSYTHLVVEKNQNHIIPVDFGVIETSKEQDSLERLNIVYEGVALSLIHIFVIHKRYKCLHVL